MEIILNQLLNQLNTPTSISNCEAFPIGTNNQSSWSEYIHYLCCQGLHETTYFINQFQPVFENNVMIEGNTLGDLYIDYTTLGHEFLDQTMP